MGKKIAVMGAMPEEIELLLPRISDKKEHIIGRRAFITGLLEGKEVVAVFSRMGKVAASSTVTTLINHFGCETILFTGVAGALDRSLNIGDIVVGSANVQHDMDVSALSGFSKFEVPLLDRQFFSPPDWLIAKALEASEDYLQKIMPKEIEGEVLSRFGITAPKSSKGLIASGDQFIASQETANELIRLLPEISCVEMEGSAVGQVAYEYGIPYVVIRTISDKADHSAHIDFPRFVREIASQFTCGVLLELLKKL